MKRSLLFGVVATAAAAFLSYLLFADFSVAGALASLVAMTAAAYWLVFRPTQDPP